MPETSNAVEPTLQFLPIDKLKPNPWNRTQFDPDALNELTASIKAGGIREPLIVRQLTADSYQITSGHRRWLAAQNAGLKEAPCWVQALTDDEVEEMNLIINLQREDLPVLEQARMIKARVGTDRGAQQALATKLGKSPAWVSELIGFMDLDPEIFRIFKALKIGWDQIRALKASRPEVQKQVAQELKEGKIKPEGVQTRCKALGGGKGKGTGKGKKAPQEPPPDPLVDLWPQLQVIAKSQFLGSWKADYKEGVYGLSIKPKILDTPRADLGRLFTCLGRFLLIESEAQANEAVPQSDSVPAPQT